MTHKEFAKLLNKAGACGNGIDWFTEYRKRGETAEATLQRIIIDGRAIVKQHTDKDAKHSTTIPAADDRYLVDNVTWVWDDYHINNEISTLQHVFRYTTPNRIISYLQRMAGRS
jgi:hypothetical protein